MTSRNWFFKLMKEDLKHRLWSIALSCLVYFFTFPILTLLMISQTRHRYMSAGLDPAMILARQNRVILNNQVDLMAYTGCSFYTLVVAGFALLFAFSGFAYLHSSKKTDFFHNLPVRREKWFAVITVDSFLICMVPYLVFGILSVLLVMINCAGAAIIPAFFSGFIANAVFFLFLFLTAVAAIMLTGNTFVGILGCGVFLFYGPFIVLMREGLLNLLRTYYDPTYRMATWVVHTSPLLWGFNAISSDMPEVPLCRFLLFTLLWVILLAALDLYLYRKRPSEAAGKAMAFPATQAPIKFLICIPVGLGCGFIAESALYQQVFWTLFSIFCGVTCSVCIMEIIYHADFKKLFAHKVHLLLCIVISLGIFAIFRWDVFGYDRYIPEKKNFESGAVASYYLEGNASELLSTYDLMTNDETGEIDYVQWHYDYNDEHAMENIRIPDYELLKAIATQGVADTAWIYSRSEDSWEEDDGDYNTFSMAFRYKGGRTVYRRYTININAVKDAIAAVYATPEFKKGTYPLLSMDPVELSGANIETIWGTDHIAFPSEQAKTDLLLTYQQELMGLTLSQRDEPILGCIQFKTYQFQKDADAFRADRNYLDFFGDNYFYPVFPSFTKTLALLENLGIHLENTLTPDMVSSIDVYNNMYYWDDMQGQDMKESVSFADPDEIRQLLACTVTNDFHYYRNSSKDIYVLDVTVNVPAFSAPSVAGFDKETYYRSSDNENMLMLRRNFTCQVPEFVLNALGIDSQVAAEYLQP